MPFAAGAEINSPSQPSGVVVVGGSSTITFRVRAVHDPVINTISNTATITYPIVNLGTTTTETINSNTVDLIVHPCAPSSSDYG